MKGRHSDLYSSYDRDKGTLNDHMFLHESVSTSWLLDVLNDPQTEIKCLCVRVSGMNVCSWKHFVTYTHNYVHLSII